jgi:hypothetical protein
MMKLQFKFKEHISVANREKVISALGHHGAGDVRPLFPDATQQKLASLYVVEIANKVVGRKLLGLLNDFEEVEFAEEEVRRELIP